MKRWIIRNPLQVLLLAIVAFASVRPDWGQTGAVWHPELAVTLAVSVMFFMHGVSLPVQDLIDGIRDWKVHSLIQGCTYLGFPLLGLVILKWGPAVIDPAACLGFFALSTTSSTIASCIALTGKSHGRVSIAIFNASISSMLGVFLTPLLLGVVASQSDLHISWHDAFEQIGIKILLPFITGQVFRIIWPIAAFRLASYTTIVDYLSIGLVVLNALSDSIMNGVFKHTGLFTLLSIVVVSVALFWVIVVALRACCRLLSIPLEDQIAVIFCGSQKSITNGLPIAKILFQGVGAFGLIILPLIVYHQCQLLFSAFLSDHYVHMHNKKFPMNDSSNAASRLSR